MSEARQRGLQLAQSQDYQGEDWWKWRVWVTGSKAQLAQIVGVVYQLHPTFPNPVRQVTSRKTNFGLTAEGWGGFTIHARVEMRNGEKVTLQHELELNYPDGTPTTA